MRIQIKEFSGPLDLLLQLIRREEMDIFDIDIHKITEQYLAFIEQNSIKDLDSAGDFIRMSALLIYIKSKRLFPSESHQEFVEAEKENEEEELEKALTFSLLKMRVLQSVSKQLSEYSLLKKDVWPSGATEDFSSQTEKREVYAFPSLESGSGNLLFSTTRDPQIKPEPLLKLLRAYHRVFEKSTFSKKGPSSLSFQEPFPFLSDCIRAIHHRLRVGVEMKMSGLTQQAGRDSLSQTTLVTFLALLELSRLGVVSLEQDKDFADIAILVQRPFKEKDFHSIQEIGT